jgi:hypothetical protein
MSLWSVPRLALLAVAGGALFTAHGHTWVHRAVTEIPRAASATPTTPAAPLCNPTKLDDASRRYAGRVARAMDTWSALQRSDLTQQSSKRLAVFLAHVDRVNGTIVRAIDAPRPDEFPLAASYAQLRGGAALEARGVQEMQHALHTHDKAALAAGRDHVQQAWARFRTTQTQLRKIQSAPPCA